MKYLLYSIKNCLTKIYMPPFCILSNINDDMIDDDKAKEILSSHKIAVSNYIDQTKRIILSGKLKDEEFDVFKSQELHVVAFFNPVTGQFENVSENTLVCKLDEEELTQFYKSVKSINLSNDNSDEDNTYKESDSNVQSS